MLPTRDHSAQPALSGSARRNFGWYLLLVSPGVWVMAVLGIGLALHIGVQLLPLLAAGPAIACAGTGRKICVTLGAACALLALVPLPGEPSAPGERISSASAVLVVTFTSYFVVRRRVRMQQAYDEVQQIAEVTQRVLLRPIPERIGPVVTAVEYLSAATGARIGGDFYEVIDTPYGVRAILGDMRGHGLDAVSGAAALLGAFREAGAVEPTLEGVAARLDAALARHTAGSRRAVVVVGRRDEFRGSGYGRRHSSEYSSEYGGEYGSGWGQAQPEVRSESGVDTRADDGDQLWAEDFATAVLVQIPYGGVRRGAGYGAGHSVSSGAGRDAHWWHGGDGNEIGVGGGEDGNEVGVVGGECGGGEARLVVCGHPAPYLIRGGQALPIAAERPTLPLGLGSLIDEPYAASSCVVPFEPGDALVFYTDGVSDARARSGEFFQFEELLRGDFGGRGPQFVAAVVRSRLLEHMRHELNDDAALLVLGRLGGDN